MELEKLKEKLNQKKDADPALVKILKKNLGLNKKEAEALTLQVNSFMESSGTSKDIIKLMKEYLTVFDDAVLLIDYATFKTATLITYKRLWMAIVAFFNSKKNIDPYSLAEIRSQLMKIYEFPVFELGLIAEQVGATFRQIKRLVSI